MKELVEHYKDKHEQLPDLPLDCPVDFPDIFPKEDCDYEKDGGDFVYEEVVKCPDCGTGLVQGMRKKKVKHQPRNGGKECEPAEKFDCDVPECDCAIVDKDDSSHFCRWAKEKDRTRSYPKVFNEKAIQLKGKTLGQLSTYPGSYRSYGKGPNLRSKDPYGARVLKDVLGRADARPVRRDDAEVSRYLCFGGNDLDQLWAEIDLDNQDNKYSTTTKAKQITLVHKYGAISDGPEAEGFRFDQWASQNGKISVWIAEGPAVKDSRVQCGWYHIYECADGPGDKSVTLAPVAKSESDDFRNHWKKNSYKYTPALTWADFPARQTVEGKEYTIWAKAAGDVFNNAPNNKHLRDFADVRSLDFRLEDNDPDAFFRNTISLAHAANVWIPVPVTMGNRGATCVEAYACVVDEDYSDSDPL
eukprot:g14331.t1